MSSLTKPRPRSATENQPNCFICSRCIPTSKSTKSGGGACKLICRRFCTLASRYLTFRTKYLNPGVTLGQNNNQNNINMNLGRLDDVEELCDACVYELRAFFETYNELSLLQLRLNRKLKEIGDLMTMRTPLQKGPRPGRKNEKKSKSEEFKRTFLEQVDKIDKDFPKLQLERLDSTVSGMKATPSEKSYSGTIVVVKQEQMETEDDFGGTEQETVTHSRLADDNRNDHDQDDDYLRGEDEDDNHDSFPNGDQGDDNFYPGTDTPQNAAGSGDGTENPEGFDQPIPDLAAGNGERRKNDTSLQCVYCGRQFAKRYTRVLHERIHTGDRPYKCSMCDREFSHLSTWRSHSEAKHKGKAEAIKPPPTIRVRNKNNWQREIAKQRRLKGEMYQGYTKELDPETGKVVFKSNEVLRKGRKLGPPCRSKKCRASERRSCNEFSESQRKEIFDHFWKKLDDWDAKKRWIRELVQIVPVRRRIGGSRRNRNVTFKYHLPLNGEMELVCGEMFLKTLALSKSMVHKWIRDGGGSDNPEGVIAKDIDKDDNQNQTEDEGGEDGDGQVTSETQAMDTDGFTQTTLCKQEHV